MKGWSKLTSGTALWHGADSSQRLPPTRVWQLLAGTRGRRLVLAVVASLALHATVLSTLRTRPDFTLRGQPLLVTVLQVGETPGPRERAGEPAPAAPAPAVISAAPEPARPAPAAKPASATAPSPRPAEAAASQPAAAAAAQPGVSAPRPLGVPELSADLQRQLIARRLLVKVTVDPSGAVTQALFVNPELAEPVLAALVEAVSRVRFTPGQVAGRRAGAVFSSRLCFDDDGLLQDGPECWVPAPR
jgi:hypothetical protein